MDNQNFIELEQEIFHAISDCRRRVLDLCELELNRNDRWLLFRKQLLKAFGNSGLESEVKRLFKLNNPNIDHGGFCA